MSSQNGWVSIGSFQKIQSEYTAAKARILELERQLELERTERFQAGVAAATNTAQIQQELSYLVPRYSFMAANYLSLEPKYRDGDLAARTVNQYKRDLGFERASRLGVHEDSTWPGSVPFAEEEKQKILDKGELRGKLASVRTELKQEKEKSAEKDKQFKELIESLTQEYHKQLSEVMSELERTKSAGSQVNYPQNEAQNARDIQTLQDRHAKQIGELRAELERVKSAGGQWNCPLTLEEHREMEAKAAGYFALQETLNNHQLEAREVAAYVNTLVSQLNSQIESAKTEATSNAYQTMQKTLQNYQVQAQQAVSQLTSQLEELRKSDNMGKAAEEMVRNLYHEVDEVRAQNSLFTKALDNAIRVCRFEYRRATKLDYLEQSANHIIQQSLEITQLKSNLAKANCQRHDKEIKHLSQQNRNFALKHNQLKSELTTWRLKYTNGQAEKPRARNSKLTKASVQQQMLENQRIKNLKRKAAERESAGENVGPVTPKRARTTTNVPVTPKADNNSNKSPDTPDPRKSQLMHVEKSPTPAPTSQRALPATPATPTVPPSPIPRPPTILLQRTQVRKRSFSESAEPDIDASAPKKVKSLKHPPLRIQFGRLPHPAELLNLAVPRENTSVPYNCRGPFNADFWEGVWYFKI